MGKNSGHIRSGASMPPRAFHRSPFDPVGISLLLFLPSLWLVAPLRLARHPNLKLPLGQTMPEDAKPGRHPLGRRSQEDGPKGHQPAAAAWGVEVANPCCRSGVGMPSQVELSS